ncbi:hypothetical protein BC833DRAFT_568886 [Globomyces pollinis-pini]|nr:hypothetical protein BC833DRAFT_568886 [Globomyces pollinis-pini]
MVYWRFVSMYIPDNDYGYKPKHQIKVVTISLVPNIVSFIVRYIYPVPIDQHFFLTLKESGLAARFNHYVNGILSWLPIVESFVWPLITFCYIQKTSGMNYMVFLLVLG